jgi:hypothetical protein
MSIYNADFRLAAIELLPTHKRGDSFVELTGMMVEPLNDVNVMLNWFVFGNNSAQWDNTISYNFGTAVRYSRRVYLRNENTDGYAAGAIPTDIRYWDLVSSNFLGVIERAMYGNGKLTLEYLLNRHFESTFRQPPLVSDIYIQNINTTDENFGVGELDPFTSVVTEQDSTALYYVSENDFIAGEKDYEIFVPIAVYNALGTTNTERDAVISGVVKIYGLAGYTFKITTY